MKDEGGPLGVAMQVEAPNRHKVLLSKAMVLSIMEKGGTYDAIRYVLWR